MNLQKLKEKIEQTIKFNNEDNYKIHCSKNYLIEHKILKKYANKNNLKLIKIREINEIKNECFEYKFTKLENYHWNLEKIKYKISKLIYCSTTHHIQNPKTKQWINVNLALTK